MTANPTNLAQNSARELAALITTLASGVLVLSVTFLEKLSDGGGWLLLLLYASWAVLGLTIVFAVRALSKLVYAQQAGVQDWGATMLPPLRSSWRLFQVGMALLLGYGALVAAKHARASSTAPVINPQGLQDSVSQLILSSVNAIGQLDFDRIDQHFASSFLFAIDGQILSNRDSLLAFRRTQLRGLKAVRVVRRQVRVVPLEADLGAGVGSLELEVTDSTGQRRSRRTSFVSVWRRTSNGWKVTAQSESNGPWAHTAWHDPSDIGTVPRLSESKLSRGYRTAPSGTLEVAMESLIDVSLVVSSVARAAFERSALMQR